MQRVPTQKQSSGLQEVQGTGRSTASSYGEKQAWRIREAVTNRLSECLRIISEPTELNDIILMTGSSRSTIKKTIIILRALGVQIETKNAGKKRLFCGPADWQTTADFVKREYYAGLEDACQSDKESEATKMPNKPLGFGYESWAILTDERRMSYQRTDTGQQGCKYKGV
jgi:hypothetical protein